MLLALEFTPHEQFNSSTAYVELLERGFLTGYYPAGNILRFDLALTIEQDDIALLLENMVGMLKSK